MPDVITTATRVDGDDAVFRALADPTRRAILDLLFERDGQSVQALCDRFSQMTRFGVMKHLAVLEAASLVSTRKVGRSKVHFHNPVPIQLIADRWISKYARPFTRALADLHESFAQPTLNPPAHPMVNPTINPTVNPTINPTINDIA